MSILLWPFSLLWTILIGLIIGSVAKFIMPGKDGGGIFVTIVLGVLGAIVGGYVGTQFGWGTVSGFDLKSFGLAVGGALVLLLLHRLLRK
jgi:uncharacterized membrane protein YeaQ/YmgE (transglycosylase-associated protein family)